jgi:magnesium transporter
LGKVQDLIANFSETYPLVTALFYLPPRQKSLLRIPWNRVVKLGEVIEVSDSALAEAGSAPLGEGELLLKDSLLDKQIVDTHGAKILRVNDLHLLRVNHHLRLVHVDVGLRGLMRRVGLEKALDKFLRLFLDYELSDHLIPWRFVQPLSSPALLRLKVAQNRLAQLHPADLADIIEELDVYKRSQVFQSLDVETAAEALEETDPKIQVRLIETLNPARASDIIEEMSPNEAADLLGDLPKEKAEGILKEMEKDIAEEVKELLVHPEEKAGGMMTTAFPTLPPEATVEEALDYLRRNSENLDLIYYIYVTDEHGHLLGVASLRDLLEADGQAHLGDIIDTRTITLKVEAEKDEIASLFAKYGLKAIPVINEEGQMKGAIPFKSLLEIVAPERGK